MTFWFTGMKNYSTKRTSARHNRRRWYWEVDLGDGHILTEGYTRTKWGARREVKRVKI